MIATTINAQEVTLKIVDNSNKNTLSGINYKYGDKMGISNNDGEITINYNSNLSLSLYTPDYGYKFFTPQEVSAFIENKTIPLKNYFKNLQPLDVIAVRNPQSNQAMSLQLNYIDKMSHDAGAILQRDAAISTIKKSGGYGFDPVFRGFKYDQLNIVLDGAQSATAACPNRMDPPTSQMAPNMIGKIEVLKGPYALRFGTGFGGTVNFISDPLSYSEKGKIYGRASSAYESNGNNMRGETQIGFKNKRLNFSLFGAWSQGNDYQSGSGDTIQSDYQRGSFGSKLGIKIKDNQFVELSAIYNRARNVDYAALPMDLINDDTWLLNAKHSIYFSNKKIQSIKTTLYGSTVDHLMDNSLKVLNPRMMDASTGAQTMNYGGRSEGMWVFNNGKLYAGIDSRTETASGTRTRDILMGPMTGKVFYDNVWQDGQISKYGAFGEYQLKKGKNQYVLSGRLEMNTAIGHDLDAAYEEIYGANSITQINPNLSFGYERKINDKFSGSIWAGRVQRSGGLAERFINFFPIGQDPYEVVGNLNLKAEKNNQIDLVLKRETKMSMIKLNIFGSYLQDAITAYIDTTLSPKLANSPGVRVMTNVKEAVKTGFEFNWNQVITKHINHQFSVAYTYAQNLVTNEAFPEIAPMDIRYSLLGNIVKDKLKPELTFRHVVKQNRISNEYGETVTPAFTLLDFGFSYEIKKNFKFNAGVNNIFNANYYEHLTRNIKGTTTPIYAVGRNFFGALSIVF